MLMGPADPRSTQIYRNTGPPGISSDALRVHLTHATHKCSQNPPPDMFVLKIKIYRIVILGVSLNLDAAIGRFKRRSSAVLEHWSCRMSRLQEVNRMIRIPHILLTVLVMSSTAVQAQVFTSSRPGVIDGPAALISGSDNGALNPNGIQPPSGFENALQSPPGPNPQQEVPPPLMPRVARHYSTPIWETSGKGGYFAIMGAVSQPGVYFQSSDHLTLGEFLKVAGGALPSANGTARIVRQGRGGLQAFISPESQYELMSGDVVLLESRHLNGPAGLREYPAAGATPAQTSSPQPTPNATPSPWSYLAFVNLAPHPILVPVPSDQATLTNVIKWLRQDPQNPPFVRVLPPAPVLRQNASKPAEQQLLENGTVLVFDPATIKRERLPGFPPVIGLPKPADSPTASAAPVVVPRQSNPADGARAPSLAPQSHSNLPDQGSPGLVKPTRAPAPPSAQLGGQPNSRGLATGTPAGGLIGVGAAVPNPPGFEEMPIKGGGNSGGPLLMMPQPNRPSRSTATSPDNKSRPVQPPKRLQDGAQHNTTPVHYEGQPMSWQSRPPVHGNGDGMEAEVDDAGVIQAHGEQGGGLDEFAGPALELPHPVPDLVHPEAAAAVTAVPAATAKVAPPAPTSSLSRQIIWFSVGSLGLLVLAVVLIARWDGPRPVRAAVTAGHVSRFGRTLHMPSDAAADSQKGLKIHKAADQPVAVPPTAVAPVSTPVHVMPSAPPRATASAPVSSAPRRTISDEELRLRTHFRQARAAARSEPAAAPSAPVEPAPTVKLRPAHPVLAQVPQVPKSSSVTSARAPEPSSDLLDRVLLSRKKAA